ncbi:DUF4124 domain-containing protein [Allofranklinella schreckenbergeri]|uniref:DUF4124 domain-containing protein n=1 Tax=Allofranklinella schreckenbergeri TaxID=1076744 RepID=A0A3M6QWW6_9BURK|nr:DUF4124 domain-containing protein [Allofranklinella schreckenbergeri]
MSAWRYWLHPAMGCWAVALGSFLAPAQAADLYKCVQAGRVSYQETACPVSGELWVDDLTRQRKILRQQRLDDLTQERIDQRQMQLFEAEQAREAIRKARACYEL